MDIGKIKKRAITEEMQESYLDYAMSVIISRALPDVRDGLKPVHRRILYAMHELGLTAGSRYRKSAAVVGEVLAKYHPHGDAAVYDSLARMAQDFSMRYPMVDGQGNFGSIDGDRAAAMRYTEAKMTKISEEMLTDIEKETVDWSDNYDGTKKEPNVLPAKLPQLLLNGTMGIAVGMATDIPPHNLGELVDGIIHLIDNPSATVEDLCKFVKGPDFPTGGIIYDQKSLINTYSTGKGPIVSRAKAEIVEKKTNQYQIIVNEVTYRVNKAELLQKVANLIKDKKIEGIRDIRDESDREGLRVVFELKNDVHPQKVLNRWYKLTDLQKTFHLNMLALVDGIQPQVLSLKAVLEYYIKHRQEVVTRRTQYLLRRAKERAHILEGLSKALDHIDEVVEIIKKSPNREKAHQALMKKFKLSDRQCNAILEMRLQTLVGLEQKKIKDELEEKKKLIKKLEILLKSPKKILNLIKKELEEIKEKYGDPRKTQVVKNKVGEINEEELIPEEECIIILTKGGYVKRVSPKTYKSQRRGGKGIIGIVPREEDTVKHFLVASTHDNVLFFTDRGRVFQTKAYEIQEAGRTARGQAIVNILQLSSNEDITALVADKKAENIKYLLMSTKNGIIKKTKIEDFAHVRRNGLIAIKLDKEDYLGWASTTSGSDEVILVTAKGQSIRFKEKDTKPMGRNAAGVRGIRLKADDGVIGMDVINDKNKDSQLLIATENGFGKKTDLKSFKIQKRGGSGIKAAKVTTKTGQIVSALILSPNAEDIIVISQLGQVIRTDLDSVSKLGRSTQGVKIMSLGRKDDKVASLTYL